MQKCPKCGHCEYQKENSGHGLTELNGFEDGDEDVAMKDDVLSELEGLMDGTLGDRLSAKKPKAIAIEVISSDDEDDQEIYG